MLRKDNRLIKLDTSRYGPKLHIGDIKVTPKLIDEALAYRKEGLNETNQKAFRMERRKGVLIRLYIGKETLQQVKDHYGLPYSHVYRVARQLEEDLKEMGKFDLRPTSRWERIRAIGGRGQGYNVRKDGEAGRIYLWFLFWTAFISIITLAVINMLVVYELDRVPQLDAMQTSRWYTIKDTAEWKIEVRKLSPQEAKETHLLESKNENN